MDIKQPTGIRGKRNQERIDIEQINDNFVVEFKLSVFQRKAIEIIYAMRAVKMSQLVDITGYSYKYITKQMLLLHINRFVERTFIPTKKDQKGTNESYFLLDEAGAIYIAGTYEIPMKEVRWIRRDNLIKYEKLNHTLQISDIRASIELEARKKDMIVTNCVSDRHLYLDYKFEDRNYVLRPDMYFRVVNNIEKYHYFVEVDLGTVAITGHSPKTTAFEDKVEYYEAYKLSGAYKDYYNAFPRVLVITTTTDRAKKLMEAVRNRQKTQVEFLFTTLALWKEHTLGPIFIKTDETHTTIFE